MKGQKWLGNIWLEGFELGSNDFELTHYHTISMDIDSLAPQTFGSNYIPRIRRIGGCYGFTSKPPAARLLPAARRPQWC